MTLAREEKEENPDPLEHPDPQVLMERIEKDDFCLFLFLFLIFICPLFASA